MSDLFGILAGALAGAAAFVVAGAAIITWLDRPTGRQAWGALWSCAAWPYYLPRHIWRVHKARRTRQAVGIPHRAPAHQLGQHRKHPA